MSIEDIEENTDVYRLTASSPKALYVDISFIVPNLPICRVKCIEDCEKPIATSEDISRSAIAWCVSYMYN